MSTTGSNWRRPENTTSSATGGLLESALARPRNAFAYGEEDIIVLAVALMAGIARAHAFEQGNKRTAFAAMRLFLCANGFDIGPVKRISSAPFGRSSSRSRR